LPDPDLTHELDAAIRLAYQAGAVIMGFYQSGLVADLKAGDEPVTAADCAADEVIVAGLRAGFPHDGILTEESDDDLSRLAKERVWIVDPLDGTAEFLSQTGEFSVHIALAWRGQPVLGVVFQPAKRALFYATHGQGAYQVADGRTARLRVSEVSAPAEMCMVASRSHFPPFLEQARQELGIRTVNRLGSVGVKVSLVARGECDLYLATTVVKEWDFCAPHALLLEAGGTLTDMCGGPMAYNKAGVHSCRGLIASNGRAHAHIVGVLAPLRGQG
jgi:3'(2'), 5'-bisphosphate nucleotidase